jgi:hypothetical protein
MRSMAWERSHRKRQITIDSEVDTIIAVTMIDVGGAGRIDP